MDDKKSEIILYEMQHTKDVIREYVGVSPTLLARMGTGGNNVPLVIQKDESVVRKLTPLECCRLQGFPDEWCQGLEIKDPSEKDINYWKEIFKEKYEILGQKMISDGRIARWLRGSGSDKDQYKMWGNAVALPCVEFILGNLARWDKTHEENVSLHINGIEQEK